MAIAWSCACGKSYSTDNARAGAQVLCPACGKLNVVPPIQQKKAAPSPIVEVEPLGDDDIEIFTEVEIEEDEIPEMDVEEDVAAWDRTKEKTRPKPKPKKKKETAPKDLTNPFDIPETADEKIDEDEAKFTKKQAETGMTAWVSIGRIKLTEVADCVALGPGGAYGLAGQDDDVLVINMFKGKKLDRFGGHDHRHLPGDVRHGRLVRVRRRRRRRHLLGNPDAPPPPVIARP